MPHKQVWAKANVPVDEHIVPLIEALSCFRGLRTEESCQGGEDGRPASVWFVCGVDGDEEETARLASWLGTKLRELSLDYGSYDLTLRWSRSAYWLQARLDVDSQPGTMQLISAALRELAEEWNSGG